MRLEELPAFACAFFEQDMRGHTTRAVSVHPQELTMLEKVSPTLHRSLSTTQPYQSKISRVSCLRIPKAGRLEAPHLRQATQNFGGEYRAKGEGDTPTLAVPAHCVLFDPALSLTPTTDFRLCSAATLRGRGGGSKKITHTE
jgi:hypothetical protein